MEKKNNNRELSLDPKQERRQDQARDENEDDFHVYVPVGDTTFTMSSKRMRTSPTMKALMHGEKWEKSE